MSMAIKKIAYPAPQDLYNGKLDIIVHVDKLGEGFDHKNLSVAVLFCPLGCMSRYSQFVGRAIRRLPDNESSPSLKPAEQVRTAMALPPCIRVLTGNLYNTSYCGSKYTNCK